MDRAQGTGEDGGKETGWRRDGEEGGSYVNLFGKGINAHGESGEKKGMEAGDGGERKPFRNLHAS